MQLFADLEIHDKECDFCGNKMQIAITEPNENSDIINIIFHCYCGNIQWDKISYFDFIKNMYDGFMSKNDFFNELSVIQRKFIKKHQKNCNMDFIFKKDLIKCSCGTFIILKRKTVTNGKETNLNFIIFDNEKNKIIIFEKIVMCMVCMEYTNDLYCINPECEKYVDKW